MYRNAVHFIPQGQAIQEVSLRVLLCFPADREQHVKNVLEPFRKGPSH